MQLNSTVHLLSRDEDAFREVLDDVDEQLLSFGVAPDDRVVTQFSIDAIQEYAELSPNGEEDPMAAVSEELLKLISDGDSDLSYARLTGMRVLDRLVREEASGHRRVGLQADKRDVDMLTEYVVYQYDPEKNKYDRYAGAEGLFEI